MKYGPKDDIVTPTDGTENDNENLDTEEETPDSDSKWV